MSNKRKKEKNTSNLFHTIVVNRFYRSFKPQLLSKNYQDIHSRFKIQKEKDKKKNKKNDNYCP